MKSKFKNIFDYKHVKSVSAIALLKDGKSAGRIVCNWSDNPAGSVCTSQVMLWDGEISGKVRTRHVKTEYHDFGQLPVVMLGKAGGYGYDKRSAAISAAIREGGIHEFLPVESGAGAERSVFEKAGFTWIEVI